MHYMRVIYKVVERRIDIVVPQVAPLLADIADMSAGKTFEEIIPALEP